MTRRRQGLFLISVLFLTVLILMFVTAAVALTPGSLGRAAQEAKLLRAQRAAQTGLAWARARLRLTPDWRALTASTVNRPEFWVRESEGQVLGWVREGQDWSRFRIRLNWQDGVGGGDGMANPASLWGDFRLISFNNFPFSGAKAIPQVTGSNGCVVNSAPTRLTLPANSALLCVEGSSGAVDCDITTGIPRGFSGPVHRKLLEVVLKLDGPNQAVSPGALMAAGDLEVRLANLASSHLELRPSANQPTRLRSKGRIRVTEGGSPNVQSTQAELTANSLSNITTSGISSGVRLLQEQAGDGFYSIGQDLVRAPNAPATPSAGTYVVNAAGQITYYDMNYSDYLAAVASGPILGGVVTDIPGFAVSLAGSSPRVRLRASQDILVSPTAQASDFVIIPDGGVPTNQYGYDATQAITSVQAFLANNAGWQNTSDNSMSGTLPGWAQVIPNLAGVVENGGSYTWTDSNGAYFTYDPANAVVTTSSNWSLAAGSVAEMAQAMANSLNPALNSRVSESIAGMAGLSNAFNQPVYVPPPAPAPPVTALRPRELELTLQAPSGGGLVVQNAGKLVFGSQVDGNGAALVSQSDLILIGTSSELSSNPGQSLGLNLYAQGNIEISPFELDSTGTGTFRKVDLRGVVYSWGNVTINVGDPDFPQNQWGDFQLDGVLVAYGGNPANAVNAYQGAATAGRIRLCSKRASIHFEPSYLMGLYQALPTPLEMTVAGWHEQ